MASKNGDASYGSPNKTKKQSKRPLTSPEDTSAPKKADNSTKPDIGECISDRLKAIRVASSQENHSYIPSATTQTQGNRFKPASECSYTGTWNRGTTDVINVEILSLNGEDFKGSFKRPEALYIWTNVLQQEPGKVHGISFKSMPRKNLQMVFRLKEKICIDTTFTRDDFSYNRGEKKPDGSYDIVCGRILGLKNAPVRNPPTERNSATRVNLYGCEFDLTKEQILNWMSKFREILSEPMDILDRECPEIATGDLSIIMRLNKQIPSFLPMYGKKIRIAYRGMTTVCSNCYDVGHMRIGCENQRANYLDYVSMLLNTERFDRSMFGNWATRAEKFQAYKANQAKTRTLSRQNYETIDEETYIDPDMNKDLNETDEENGSISSFKSTGTIIDEDPPETQTDPSNGKVIEKVTSFESRTKNKK